MKRIYIYARISEDRSGEELGVSRQLEDAKAIAEQRGWHVVEIFSENDVSASGRQKRPLFERLMSGLADGQADGVLAWDMYRLLRSARDRLWMLELGKTRGLLLAFVRGADLDLSTPSGRMTADILGAVALNEIEVMSDRRKRAHAQAARDGRWIGGRRPFGYDDDGVTIRETEAAALREAYSLVLAGGTLRGIARALNEAGLPTSGKRRNANGGGVSWWTGNAIGGTLRNPRYAGIMARQQGGGPSRVYEEIGPAKWPAIVDEEVFRAVDAILRDPARRSNGIRRFSKRLLTGIATCGCCGSEVTSGGASPSSGGRYPTYRCKERPGHLSRKVAPIDEYVEAYVIERLDRPDLAGLVSGRKQKDAKRLQLQRTSVKTKLDQLAIDYAEDLITRSQMLEGTARAREALAELDDEISHSVGGTSLAPFLTGRPAAEVWASLSHDQRRTIIALLADVTIMQVRRGSRVLDPDSVVITPKRVGED